MIIDYSACRFVQYFDVYDRERKKVKATNEQINAAILACLGIQPLTKENLLNDVILELSKGNKRAFLANYSDMSTEQGKVEFNKDLEPCLNKLRKSKAVTYKNRVWYKVSKV